MTLRLRPTLRARLAAASLLTALLAAAAPAGLAGDSSGFADADGRTLLEAVYARHRQYPYVYEEQSMILVDRQGNKRTRRYARYSRVEDDGTTRFLLHFRFPREIQGVALLAARRPDGQSELQLFLPALGHHLITRGTSVDGGQARAEDRFLGTDFTIENLTGEILDDYRFARRRDTKLADTEYFVVDVYPPAATLDVDPPRRRHFILKQGLFIARTDHFSETGRLVKRQTRHDLVVVNADSWRANMLLMENFEQSHRTIIKIDRRVFSPDYVPEAVFSAAWIFQNAPAPEPEEPPSGETDPSEHLHKLATGARGVAP